MLGQLSPDEMAQQYAACDVVLFPVEWDEPWGLVPLEAMAVGRPVIATGKGGSGEYLRHEENCLLTDAGDPEALKAAVGRLASDEALRRRLRTNGFETASQHTLEQFVQRTADAHEAAYASRA
jgi:glycosyltransferase involved in cell wall biosynthesis